MANINVTKLDYFLRTMTVTALDYYGDFDGHPATYYLDYNNLTNTPGIGNEIDSYLSGITGSGNGNVTFFVSGKTSVSWDSSHNHSSATEVLSGFVSTVDQIFGGNKTFSGATTLSKNTLYPLEINSNGSDQGAIGIQFNGHGSNIQKGYIQYDHSSGYSPSVGYSIHLGSTEPITDLILNGSGNMYVGNKKVLHDGVFNSSGFITTDGSGNYTMDSNTYSETTHTHNSYVTFSGAISDVDLNNKILTNVNKLGVSVSNPTEIVDILGNIKVRGEVNITNNNTKGVKMNYNDSTETIDFVFY